MKNTEFPMELQEFLMPDQNIVRLKAMLADHSAWVLSNGYEQGKRCEMECEVYREESFDLVNLRGAVFKSCDFSSSTFKKADLRDVTFIGCDLSEVVFTDAHLAGATFINCNLNLADFTDAYIDHVLFKGSPVQGAYMNVKSAFGVVGYKVRVLQPGLVSETKRRPLERIVYTSDGVYVGHVKFSMSYWIDNAEFILAEEFDYTPEEIEIYEIFLITLARMYFKEENYMVNQGVKSQDLS